MCVISRLNSDMLEELVELANELGVYIVFQLYHDRKTAEADVPTFPFPPDCYCLGLSQRLEPDEEFNIGEVSQIVSTLMRLKKIYWSLISSEAYLAGMIDYQRNRLPGCFAGRKYFSIDPYGYLHPCVDLPSVGHILRDDISVFQNPRASELVRQCSGCWYCFRGKADISFSISGCMSRILQHGRIMYQNQRRKQRFH